MFSLLLKGSQLWVELRCCLKVHRKEAKIKMHLTENAREPQYSHQQWNLAQTPWPTFLTLQEQIFNECILLKPKPETNLIALWSPGRSTGSALTQETECHLLNHKWHLHPLLCMGRNCNIIPLKCWWKSALFSRVAAPFLCSGLHVELDTAVLTSNYPDRKEVVF